MIPVSQVDFFSCGCKKKPSIFSCFVWQYWLSVCGLWVHWAHCHQVGIFLLVFCLTFGARILTRSPALSFLCCVTSAILMEFTGHDPGTRAIRWWSSSYSPSPSPLHTCLLAFSLAAVVLLVSDIVHKLLLISPAPLHLASVLLGALLERLGERSVIPHLLLVVHEGVVMTLIEWHSSGISVWCYCWPVGRWLS